MKAKFVYTGIRVNDIEESVRFYSRILGMKEAGRGTFDQVGGTFVSLVSEDGGFELELNHYRKGSRFATPYAVGEALDHLAFKVPDLDEALAEAARAGYPVLERMQKGPESRWAYIRDPNGIEIELTT